MKKIFLTGVQGSGKTTVSAALAQIGYSAIDSDNFAQWVDNQNRPLTSRRPANPSPEWLRTHYWVWQQDKLRTILAETANKPLIICGLSYNQDQYYDLFDQIILLSLNQKTVRERLFHRDNGSSFGKQPHELAFILERHKLLEDRAKEAGAIIVDASLPLATIVPKIAKAIEQKITG